MNKEGKPGAPGEPGEASIGQTGGRGGEGGAGGKGGVGEPTGRGGAGGEGGPGARGEPGPRGEPGREGLPPKWKRGLIIWIAVFTGFSILMWRSNRDIAQDTKSLAQANKVRVVENRMEQRQRIAEIQKNRVASCKQTYEAFRIVLGPFIPPRRLQSPEQRRRITRFNKIVDERKRNCAKQVNGG